MNTMRFPANLERWRFRNEEAIHRRTIIGAIKEHEAGAKVDDICHSLSVYTGTFYNWRSKAAGLEFRKANRLIELEPENGKLKKRLVEKLLENEAMKDVPQKSTSKRGQTIPLTRCR